MLQITVVTLFPDMFRGILSHSMMKRAVDGGNVDVHLLNFRDYAIDKHKTVDDAPFGGGAGMLLKPAPLFDAIESIRPASEKGCDVHDSELTRPVGERVVLMSPQGRPFSHDLAVELSRVSHLVLVCGHYEGVDERVREHLVTDEISLGDFVLTGGEIAAMAVMDAVIRFLPGVLGNGMSAHTDSFASGLLEYPQYTRPSSFRDWSVPATLMSGNHSQIEKWRHKHSLYRTWARRPELLRTYPLTSEDKACIARWESGDFTDLDLLEPKHRRTDGE
jgi:tRNA (guanine37-N1)-methyltransferase